MAGSASHSSTFHPSTMRSSSSSFACRRNAFLNCIPFLVDCPPFKHPKINNYYPDEKHIIDSNVRTLTSTYWKHRLFQMGSFSEIQIEQKQKQPINNHPERDFFNATLHFFLKAMLLIYNGLLQKANEIVFLQRPMTNESCVPSSFLID